LVERKREWLNGYKISRGCSRCGYNTHPSALDLHHREPALKLDTVSQMAAKNRSWNSIYVEVEKCDVVCANCHRIEHA
jgi:hypothetical protein